MDQNYVPFSKLAVDTVFKILDKEKSGTKYGERLVLKLEQNPADDNYDTDDIIKTLAPKCLKEKMTEDTGMNEYIISKGNDKGKKTIKLLYLESDSNSYPQEADFEGIKYDPTQAKKMDAILKVDHTYIIKDVFYFYTKYGESGIARLKYEETKETVIIYLPKSLKQKAKITRKRNNNKVDNEKIKFEGFKIKGQVKVYKYKYTFNKSD